MRRATAQALRARDSRVVAAMRGVTCSVSMWASGRPASSAPGSRLSSHAAASRPLPSACTSIGAVWSVCAPDMGVAAVVDRFKQIEPKVLIAVDGVFYGGKPLDRSAVVQSLLDALPSVQHHLVVRSPSAAGSATAPSGSGVRRKSRLAW